MAQVHKVNQVDRMGFCITCHLERDVSRTARCVTTEARRPTNRKSGMTDTQGPDTLDRRRFLTVLGTTTAGGALALSGCSTDRVQKLVPYLVQSEIRSPGWRPGTPAPAPNATRAAACTCAPARGARSSWKGIPTTRSTRGRSAPGPGRAAGAVQPGRVQSPMARGRQRAAGADHLG
jgi:hypothetical protein